MKKALVKFSLAHLPIGATLEAQANLLAKEGSATHTGLCLYLQNTAVKPLWTLELKRALCGWAETQRLARLSIDDHDSPLTLYEPTQPRVRFGSIDVTPPPGAFLQATVNGEHSLQQSVAEILAGHNYIVDLFAGCGTLSLPLIDQLSGLLAVESDIATLAALKAGVDASGHGGRLTIQNRNLFEAPLLPEELAKTTGVIQIRREVAPLPNANSSAADVANIAMKSRNQLPLPEMPPF